MNNIKKRYLKRTVIIMSIITFVLLISVTILSIIIFNSDILEKTIDKTVTNNISFNDSNTTDIIKITDLKKLSDEKGRSKKNKNFKEFTVSGNENSEFEIVLYHIGNAVDEQFINYEIIKSTSTITDNLGAKPETEDGGKIIYEGKIDDYNDYKIKMWVDKQYKENIENVSYEIRIRSR